jgi:predicted small secreted protein
LTVEILLSRFDVGFTEPKPTSGQHNRAADSTGVSWMPKTFRLALTLVTLIGVAPVLSACHTTAGVGQDLSQGGHALSNSANANAPTSPHP